MGRRQPLIIWLRHRNYVDYVSLFVVCCGLLCHAESLRRTRLKNLPALTDINYKPYTVINVHPEVSLEVTKPEAERLLLERIAENHRVLEMGAKDQEVKRNFNDFFEAAQAADASVVDATESAIKAQWDLRGLKLNDMRQGWESF